jgi:hypothetical protein
VSGGWGCPHEVDGICGRVRGALCEPGMRGCVLYGKVTFPDQRSHLPRWPTAEELEERRSSEELGSRRLWTRRGARPKSKV